ncbi:MAG TPA: hypothetical protein VEV17_04940 [Bryobacteraceae bacterium]|nr:hypothetical protein [Bryobacteraceae bacterium]
MVSASAVSRSWHYFGLFPLPGGRPRLLICDIQAGAKSDTMAAIYMQPVSTSGWWTASSNDFL